MSILSNSPSLSLAPQMTIVGQMITLSGFISQFYADNYHWMLVAGKAFCLRDSEWRHLRSFNGRNSGTQTQQYPRIVRRIVLC